MDKIGLKSRENNFPWGSHYWNATTYSRKGLWPHRIWKTRRRCSSFTYLGSI